MCLQRRGWRADEGGVRRAGLILINDPLALRRYGQRLKLVRIDSGFEAQLRYGPIVAWGEGGQGGSRPGGAAYQGGLFVDGLREF